MAAINESFKGILKIIKTALTIHLKMCLRL
jgi:hypothetical protein